ncbi:hypothetical protein GCM10010401_21090 [Rarobacter faecitabidus]|uniref:Biotin transport system permease protein n=1 Tax=Rarobacter faecitabidus TaxID=13243 RepID=A0A542ZVC4_RARFA|nr:energy-coupling factor transporter transmembrane protein EcfT [Rarobacter faecitabidus]TQL64313.1 biotin transport system permease protein [Rarobacter faecitabidus]
MRSAARTGRRARAEKSRPLRSAYGGVLGAYVARDSVLHRAPVLLKLALLAFISGSLALIASPWLALAGVLVGMGAGLIAGIRWRRVLFGAVRGMLALLPLALLVAWQRGPLAAAEVTGDILAAILLALAFTASTRADHLLDSIVRTLEPLRRFGVNPERASLLVGLMVRTIPVLVTVGVEVRDAARARGLSRSPRTFAGPFAVRAVGYAFSVGDAIAARAIEDE